MKSISISIISALVIISAAFLIVNNKSGTNFVDGSNVTIIDGRQIIEIHAKGGYQPTKSVARAGIPTIIRFDTGGTFDCSASVRIPSLNISKILPQSGSTDIDVGSPTMSRLQGMCGMGMYPFEIDFKS